MCFLICVANDASKSLNDVLLFYTQFTTLEILKGGGGLDPQIPPPLGYAIDAHT